MKNMRMPGVYDIYSNQNGRLSVNGNGGPSVYATNIYDTLTPMTPNYGSLATLQPAQLQPTYANLNLLAANAAVAGVPSSAADYYANSAAVDYYSRMRPLQNVYGATETTEELVDRSVDYFILYLTWNIC